MSAAVLVLLVLVGVLPGLVARVRPRPGGWLGSRLATVPARMRGYGWSVVQVGGLALAGLLAARSDPVGATTAGLAQVVGVLAASGGAGPVVLATFRVARRTAPPGAPVAELLHGGAVIGVLERAAVAVTLLAGFGEGLALVLAVKSLARYPELREARAGEQFIIGTFTSVLWAVSCWGTVAALLH